jgi:hypothetical protein
VPTQRLSLCVHVFLPRDSTYRVLYSVRYGTVQSGPVQPTLQHRCLMMILYADYSGLSQGPGMGRGMDCRAPGDGAEWAWQPSIWGVWLRDGRVNDWTADGSPQPRVSRCQTPALRQATDGLWDELQKAARDKQDNLQKMGWHCHDLAQKAP